MGSEYSTIDMFLNLVKEMFAEVVSQPCNPNICIFRGLNHNHKIILGAETLGGAGGNRSNRAKDASRKPEQGCEVGVVLDGLQNLRHLLTVAIAVSHQLHCPRKKIEQSCFHCGCCAHLVLLSSGCRGYVLAFPLLYPM